jgi:hypothetical protein
MWSGRLRRGCRILSAVPRIEVIPAFLASPGDLADERSDARDVVDKMNMMLGDTLGLRIELFGWEDQPPGYGRPQGQINPRVDDAELFIGLLWRRWGMPPGEGFTSGFEEEYRRAIARREAGQPHPHIWLFFKDVDPGQLADPGEELQQVLAFKAEVQAKREVLYRSFLSKTDWREQLLVLLANFLAERTATTRTEADRASPPALEAAGAEVPAGDEQAVERSVAQVLEALDSAARQVREDHAPPNPDTLTAVRVLLAASDWVSRSNTGSVLETHEANLLYALRADVEPTTRELLQLMRSMVTGGDLRPGWAWFTDLPEGRAPFLLAYLGRTDRNSDVRRAAVALLGDASLLGTSLPPGVDPDEWGPAGFLAAIADDSAQEVRAEAMRLLGRAATDDAIERLRTAMGVAGMRSTATDGLVDALLRRDPSQALQLVVEEYSYLPSSLMDKLLRRARDFGEEPLRALWESRSSAQRQLALRIADASGRLSEEETSAALDDPNADVKVLAIDLRLKHGWPVDDEVLKKAPDVMRYASRTLSGGEDAERMVKLRRMLSEEELRAKLNWYLVDGPSVYEALGRAHFDTFGEQLRRDLDDAFNVFREESLAALQERFHGVDISGLTEDTAYTEPAFTGAALEVLAEHGTSEDRDRILCCVGAADARLQACALHALARIGEPADAARAIDVATDTDNGTADSRLDAAQIALALSHEAVNELLEAGDPGVVHAAVVALGLDADGVDKLKALLNHGVDEVRVAAVARLASALDRDELQTVIDAYVQQERYFYNVVVWLDRLVFAPEPLRVRFAEQLGI